MKNILTDSYIDRIARNRGYIDYQSDSVEAGSVWHTNPETAPFGGIITKVQFREDIRALAYNLTKNPELVNIIKAHAIVDAVNAHPETIAYLQHTGQTRTNGVRHEIWLSSTDLVNYANKLRDEK